MKFSIKKSGLTLVLFLALILSSCEGNKLSAPTHESSEGESLESVAENKNSESEKSSSESSTKDSVSSEEVSETLSQLFQTPEEYIRYGFADAVERASASVVSIDVSKSSSSLFGEYSVKESGSGVVISKTGYIATNFHVVDGAKNVIIRFADGGEYNGTVVGKDAKTDLAVIKIECESELTPAVFASSSTLRKGDFVFAVGNALGKYSDSVTMGIVSALSRDVVVNGETMKMLQTDAALNSGNSGGGIFDSEGYLIGIVSAKDSDETAEGVAFAVPIDVAKEVFNDLIQYGYVTGRPTLGFTTADITSMREANYYGVDWIGVYISKVDEGSNGETAGLRSRDYIYSVNEEVITTTERLNEILEESKVGDTLLLEIWRGNDSIDVILVIGEDVG